MQIMSFYISLNQESDLISDPDKPTELPEFFPCEHFDQTIPWYQTCNNYPDCVDGSDENICGTRQKCKYRAYMPTVVHQRSSFIKTNLKR